MKQAHYYNRGARPLQPLNIGDTVRVQTDRGAWPKGTVQGTAGTPNSFRVALESGVSIRRNRSHLRRTAEPCRPRQDVAESATPSPQSSPVVPDSQPPERPPPPLPTPLQLRQRLRRQYHLTRPGISRRESPPDAPTCDHRRQLQSSSPGLDVHRSARVISATTSS